MNVPIPPEFEAFAREQVAAGRYSYKRMSLPTR
jgi:Arc/MetJ-type ribon-helix-helix transcriptional regulator